MEIGLENSKILVNRIKPRSPGNIKINGQVPEEVVQFKFERSTQNSDMTSLKEAKVSLAQAHSTMTRLVVLWRNKGVSFTAKIEFQSMTANAGRGHS